MHITLYHTIDILLDFDNMVPSFIIIIIIPLLVEQNENDRGKKNKPTKTTQPENIKYNRFFWDCCKFNPIYNALL